MIFRFVFAAIVVLFTFVIPATGLALDVSLEWDPLDDPSVAGYQIFVREQGTDYDYDNPWWEGDHTFTQCTIEGLDEDATYYFVLRVVTVHEEQSDDSNEVASAADQANSDGSASGDTAGSLGRGSGGSSAGCFIKSLLVP